ncbi:MAG: radical SAM protein [Deltaproteobacteria bacterium]|nr:radical SAM protein [Deltaproteobacteria bacterium]
MPSPTSSVLVGGGTPTYPTVAQLGRFLDAFTRKVDLSAFRQFSFEAEPASITGAEGLEKLKLLASYGVDRISLGVQSFDDHVLKAMGRIHTGEEAVDAVRQIRRAGIGSISIDLIYGYQDQSVADWIHTLETALASGVDAWHLYRLRIQRHGDVQGKVLGRYKDQRDRFPGLDDVRLMKAVGFVFSLENDRDQHFTRIFSRDRSHVTQYMWDYCCDIKDVIGLGISSWANHWRTFTLNVGGNFDRYRDLVTQGRLPVDRGLVRDAETDARRSLISPLKNDSVHKARFTARTGMDAAAHRAAEVRAKTPPTRCPVGDASIKGDSFPARASSDPSWCPPLPDLASTLWPVRPGIQPDRQFIGTIRTSQPVLSSHPSGERR